MLLRKRLAAEASFFYINTVDSTVHIYGILELTSLLCVTSQNRSKFEEVEKLDMHLTRLLSVFNF